MGTLELRSRAPSEPGTTVVALGGPLAPSEIQLLCTRLELLIRGSNRRTIDCDVSTLEDADCVAVDALARMALTCRRAGRRLRLRGAARELEELLVLAGLGEVVPCLPE